VPALDPQLDPELDPVLGPVLAQACNRLAQALGWPAGEAARLATGGTFQGPQGSACRLEQLPLRPGHPVEVRLSVLLPLRCADLWGPQVDRLLQVQSALHGSWGWWLGRSIEGLLDVSPAQATPAGEDWHAVLLEGERLAAAALKLLLAQTDAA
jgi:hypothetical protein